MDSNQIPLNNPVKKPEESLSQPKNRLNLLLIVTIGMNVVVILLILFLYIRNQILISNLTLTQTPKSELSVNPTLSPLDMFLSKPTIKLLSTPTPTLTSTPTPTPSPTPISLKTYTSPVISDNFYSFQLSYPSSWVLSEQYTSEEPKSLNLTLINEKQGSILIAQGNLKVINCIYNDDSDYNNYSSEAEFFSSYTQLNKPALWRIGQNKDDAIKLRTVCEKTSNRYVNITKIGWIGIEYESSMSEIQSILDSIILKPTALTKTIFD